MFQREAPRYAEARPLGSNRICDPRSATARLANDCAPIAGADILWARPQLKWLVVGEIHGSAEMPAAFADLVCLAATHSRRPIVVGIELPPDEQTRLNAYMVSDGGADARNALFTGLFWHPRFSDGRSSQAWFGLIERMRQLKQQGRIANLVAVPQSNSPGAGQAVDQAAAEAQLAEGMRATVDGGRALAHLRREHPRC